MIKIYLFLTLFSLNAWSRVSLELVINNPSVKQGEIVVGRLIVKQAEGKSALSGLKGKNIGKTLYILNVSPFMGKQGQLESEAKVIFLAVPQTTALSETINGEEIFISWNNIEVIPTEVSKSFLLGDFEIPERKKIIFWILLILSLCLLSVAIFWSKNYFKKKKTSRDKICKLKQELTTCTSYEDIVMMWRDKRRYIEAFPKTRFSFEKLEDVLFKYQFKSQQTQQEMQEVVAAYQTFKTDVLGDLNGV